MIRFHHLRSRIIVFFTILLVVVEGSAFMMVSMVNARNARDTIDGELQTGGRVFDQQLALRREQLTQAAQILAADFGFREAVATNDIGTIESVLTNHGDRIHANLMMLFSPDGKLLADTLHDRQDAQAPLLPALLDEARERGQASAIRLINGAAYQLVIVPVKAPLPIAWVVMGFIVDDRIAADLRTVTGLQVSFLGRDGEGLHLLASTLPPDSRGALAGLLASMAMPSGKMESLRLDGHDFESRLAPLDGSQDHGVIAVLQRSIDEALAPYRWLRDVLVIMGVASLLASALGSYFIARGITRPLANLTASATRIRIGEYSAPIEIAKDDEIGVLADSLNHMREGIASREREILRLAYDDPLTGLPNRLMFNNLVQQQIGTGAGPGGQFAVLMMDLDRFKLINNTLGHAVGDAVIKAVATRLHDLVGVRGTVARLGGDEFGLLLELGTADSVRETSKRIIKALESPVAIEGQPIDVGASIGIAIYPGDGDDPSTLIRRADAAMYVAKEDNTGFAFCDVRSDVERQDHLSLLGELRRAIEQDELFVVYQPKICLRSGKTSGVEALVRWQHPRRGLVPPMDFIPFAERTGYIRAVTRKVLDLALRDAGGWIASGFELQLSINISTGDLLDTEFPGLLQRLIEEHRVPAQRVVLEITESSFMRDPALALSTLHQLDALGLQMSIDDFGTGYSSLAYLKKLPVDEIKIDQTFVRNMVTDSHDLAIVRSTVDLARNLGLKVVAEGVEDQRCFDQLRQLGCNEAQGYYMSRPLSEDALRAWLHDSIWGHPVAPQSAAATLLQSGARA